MGRGGNHSFDVETYKSEPLAKGNQTESRKSTKSVIGKTEKEKGGNFVNM